MFAFSEPRLRSFTICKLKVCIVLAGTSFATTGGLSPQRSQQNFALKTERIENISFFRGTPSEIFFKISRPPLSGTVAAFEDEGVESIAN